MAPGAPSVSTKRLSVTKVPYRKTANKLQILTDAFPGRQTSSHRAVDALHVEDAGHLADGGHDLVEVFEVEDLDRDLDAAAVVGGDRRVRGADVGLDVLDGVRHVGDHARPVLGDGEEFDGVGGLARPRVGPLDLDDALGVDHQLLDVRAAPRVDGDALAARDVADDLLAADGVAAARARHQQVVHAAHDDGVLAEAYELLDGLHAGRQAAPDRRILPLLHLRELLGPEVLGDDVTRHGLPVPDGRQQVVHAPVAVLVRDALQGAVRVGQHLLPREVEARGLLLEELPAQLDTLGPLLLGDGVADAVARARGLDEVEPVARGLRAGRGENLDHVAVLDGRPERHHPAVDARARAGVADLGVDHEGEVDGGGAARELDDLALRREGVDVLRVEVELEGFEEVARVLHLLRPLDERAEPLERLVVVVRAAAPLLVFPVRGHALLGDAVHLLGADLYLEGLPLVADDGGVERAVEVVARRGDPVLEAPRDGLPEGVDDAEGAVAVARLVGRDDARGDEVVDLVELDLLALELLPDGEEPLDAPLDRDEGDAGLAHLLLDALGHRLKERLVLGAAALQLLGQRPVLFGVEVFEGEVFQLGAQAPHAEAVRDGREDVERLLRDAAALLRLEVLERAHVVEPVGQLDEDDAHVVHHREEHLADVLGLLLLARLVADVGEFREAVHEVRDLLAEGVADDLGVDERVLDHVVQEPRGDRDLVEAHVGEDVGDFQGVHEVGLAGGARLPLVVQRGEEVGPPEHLQVGLRVVLPDFLDDLLDANHKEAVSPEPLATVR